MSETWVCVPKWPADASVEDCLREMKQDQEFFDGMDERAEK